MRLADSTKWNQPGLFSIVPLEAIDMLMTGSCLGEIGMKSIAQHVPDVRRENSAAG